jgi:hypothetical protein
MDTKMDDPLAVYLHDYLAGAASAIDLLESMAKHYASDPLGQFAAALLVQVQHDRDTLRSLAGRIGNSSSGLKDAAAWFAEKVSRLLLIRFFQVATSRCGAGLDEAQDIWFC